MNRHLADSIEPPHERWTLDEVTFSWDDAANPAQSAADIYAELVQHHPAVVLTTRVPTLTLPCRSYARGAASEATVEVFAEGQPYRMQVRLTRSALALPWGDIVPLAQRLDRSFASGLTRRRIDLHLEAQDAPIPTGFTVAQEAEVPLAQWFGDTRRLCDPASGDLSVERSFVIRNAGETPRIHAQSGVSSDTTGAAVTVSWTGLLAQAVLAVEA